MMNLIWSVLEMHHSSIDQTGSLMHLFAILEKTRLGSEHPDYHMLLLALTQVLDGLILNAWQMEVVTSGHSSLNAFAESKPAAEEIIRLAWQIIDKYQLPLQNLNWSTKSFLQEI